VLIVDSELHFIRDCQHVEQMKCKLLNFILM